jgi:hypothetical protein
MAEPIIIVKENPGTLRIEVYDEDGKLAGTLPCPSVSFDSSSEITVDGDSGGGPNRYKPKRGTPQGTALTLKIRNPAAG